MFYAMREALAVMQEEGLAAMWARHKEMHERLWLGLSELGLEPFVEADADRCVFFFFVVVVVLWECALFGGQAAAVRQRFCTERHARPTRPQHALSPKQTTTTNKHLQSLITVNTIKVPEGVDWAAVVKVRGGAGGWRRGDRHAAAHCCMPAATNRSSTTINHSINQSPPPLTLHLHPPLPPPTPTHPPPTHTHTHLLSPSPQFAMDTFNLEIAGGLGPT